MTKLIVFDELNYIVQVKIIRQGVHEDDSDDYHLQCIEHHILVFYMYYLFISQTNP